MARSLLGGLLEQGVDAASLAACDPVDECLKQVVALGAVHTSTDNRDVIADADVAVLAIKPQVMASVLEPLQPQLQKQKPLLISIAAGISTAALQRWAGDGVPIVRCMPNTPALLQQGATALFATSTVSDAQREQAESILAAVGRVWWVEEESLIDAVTAVSGSGPAYFFLLMEAMQEAGTKLGLPPELAEALTQQTALGAASMAVNGDVGVDELRRRVTSPNGTTQAALESFDGNDFRAIVEQALRAAAERSVSLEQELCN